MSGTQTVSESNLLQYLGLIEKRFALIIEFYKKIAKEVPCAQQKNQTSSYQQQRSALEKAEAMKQQKAENAKIPDFGTQRLSQTTSSKMRTKAEKTSRR